MQNLPLTAASAAVSAAPKIGWLGPNSGQRLIAGLAALAGVLLTGLTCSLLPAPAAGLPLLMGAVGSVSVLLFVVPASPFAQPWAIIGGNVISALVGVACAQLIPNPVFAAAIAVSGAILIMSLCRCLHPPGGASALAGVMGGPALAAAGWIYPAVLFVDCVILVLCGLVIHALLGNRYPQPAAAAPAPARPAPALPPVLDPAVLERLARAAVPVSAPATAAPGGRLDTWLLSSKITLLTALSLVALSLITFGATRYIMISGGEERAVERQEANMRVAWDALRQYGTAFSTQGDRLLVGNRVLNDFFAPVDRVEALVGGTATIFLGDRRISTNVLEANGARAIGTTLTSDEVRSVVLEQGRPYRGRADILGRSFFTAYDPIKDRSGRVIGMLYVGVPAADFLADIGTATWQIALVGMLVTLGAAWLCRRQMRRMFAPLTRMCGVMGELAQGNNAVPIDGLERPDEIGTIARSVAVFRDVAIAKADADAVQQAVVADLARRLHHLAARDLTARIDDDYPREYAQLRTDFNAAVGNLDEAIGAVGQHSTGIRRAVAGLAEASDDLARKTERNAATLNQTSAGLGQVTGQVQRNAELAGDANGAVRTINGEAIAGGEILRDAINAMRGIQDSTAQIAQVTGLIDGLAFQTNLLALNAAIEAGHAGEAGRGFAVIAGEVRGLAQRSARAAEEIKSLVTASTAQVDAGALLVEKTGGAFNRITTQVEAIGGVVGTIAASAGQQAVELRSVTATIAELAEATQRNGADVETHHAVTLDLSGRAATLDQLVAGFRTAHHEPAEGAKMRRRRERV
ncbi:HPP family protein [Sphingomonas sp.]|jgi:methyl-accepting chemotaxis protein|uniref:HPP family protein n=1 Tax=Sphingomonas sp. TaxID=28214 RepID=UPI002EDB40CA